MERSHFVGTIILILVIMFAAGFIIQDSNRYLQETLDENTILSETNERYAGIIDDQRHEIKNLKGQLENYK